MAYDVEYTDEFGAWWDGLSVQEQVSIEAVIDLLVEWGPRLGHPHSSAIYGSRHSHMRELRVQHQGRPYRILYAFDPRRTAILLIGGDKTGQARWYSTFVPMGDDLYDQHLREIRGHPGDQHQ